MVSRRRLLGLAAFSITAGCVTAPADPADDDPPVSLGREAWAMVGVDAANTGHNPDVTGPDEAVGERWRRPLSGAWAPKPPTVSEGTVYAQAGTEVYAFDAADGVGQWSTDLDLKTYRYSPTVGDDRVYVAAIESVDHDTPGAVYALDRADGEIVWEVSNPIVDTTPKLVDGTVYFTSLTRDGELTVHSHDAADGDETWTATLTGEQEFRPTKRWPPAVAGGTIYVGVPGAPGLSALDATDGSTRWRESFDDPLMSSAAVADGAVYVVDRSGSVHALDPDTGTTLWSADTDEEFGPVTATPAVADGTIVVADYYRVLAVDADSGDVRWSRRKQTTENTYLGIADGTVFTGGHAVAAYDLVDGTEIWSWSPSGYSSLLTGCAVAGGVVYINSCIKENHGDLYDHHLHSLGPR